MTVYDAYINVFENKFHYNHWRPYTAIRWAANDENPDTEPDPEWNNLHKHTYAFPSYPSAHGTASTAAMTVLASTLGTGDKYNFTMTTEEVDKAGPFSEKVKMDPPTRTFNSFSQAGMEAGARPMSPFRPLLLPVFYLSTISAYYGRPGGSAYWHITGNH
ncbi:MAG: hypothetical protein DHS20C18_41610 [Saprospiraceae bacterium]|nr:MAG: hypothetical protein DHS20C18_41610 [Saprospiraceae bacterium]